MTEPKNVAILIFDAVEVLDFAGPFEIFSVTGRRSGIEPFSVYTVAENAGPVLARNEFSVNPRYRLDDCPAPDILVVPGGHGSRQQMRNQRVLDWIRQVSDAAELTLSVCTGALMLAKAGLLDGLRATTHFSALDLLAEIAPKTRIERDTRFVDCGSLITSAGVAAGIDMSLHVVARLLGEEIAIETAAYIEYPWQPQA